MPSPNFGLLYIAKYFSHKNKFHLSFMIYVELKDMYL